MVPGRPILWFLPLLIAAGMLLPGSRGLAQIPFGGLTPSGQFELSDTVQLDQADHAVLAQLERAKACLADRQWNEAIETLRQLSETSEGKLLRATDQRYLSLRDFCQLQLAALPPDALRLYRGRVDPVAQKWYEAGIARRDRRTLLNVAEQAFASSYGDKALMALGDMALESGDYAAARWCWQRIVPPEKNAHAEQIPRHSHPEQSEGSSANSEKILRFAQDDRREPSTWPGYPDTTLDLAAVRARLVLASILEGAADRARAELAQFARLHGDARGPLGGREVKYVEALGALLAESAAWPQPPLNPDWLTFGGNVRRNKIASRLIDVGAVAWRLPLEVSPAEPAEGKAAGKSSRESLSYEPLAVGNLVLVSNHHSIQALRIDNGRPAWGNATAIYRSQLTGVAIPPAAPPDTLGSPRFTMTVFAGRLYARMGSAVTSQPQGAAAPVQPGYLVCLDLNAEGRLLWKTEPEEGWAFEGSPVVDAQGVYVAMRRSDIRPQAFVACLDAETGRRRWRRFVCGAETPARGILCECTHNLLTLAGDTLYYNTNLGAVAAMRTGDGRLLWVGLYPRARRGDLAKLPPHWQRGPNPCVYDRGTLLTAPADSPRIFAFDAATGQMLWQTGTEVEDASHLLGTAGDWLIAGGRRLYWISLKEEDRGRVKHVWPDGDERPGYGRGVLAGQSILWPTRDKLYVFDLQTAQPKKVVNLTAREASGGNLLVASGRLLIATAGELIALSPYSGSSKKDDGVTDDAPPFSGRRHVGPGAARATQATMPTAGISGQRAVGR